MKANKVLDNKVKELISLNAEIKLNHPVFIRQEQYAGYNYETQKHETIMLDWTIKEIFRDGKKGVVYVSDGFNRWRLNELTESECSAILKEIA